MKRTTTWASCATALCLAILAGQVLARPAPEVGARMPGSRIATNADGMHTCAVKEDSTVRCWGFNAGGQLGDGTTTNRSSPVQVPALSGAVSVATGDFHSCALLSGGTVRCWGANTEGQLGDGSTSTRLTPVAVSGLVNAVALTAGNFHTCAVLVDGSARCWGRNLAGQIGDGSTTRRLVPVAVNVANVVALAAGSTHTCALLADGTARCWGANAQGQVGDGSTTGRLSPVVVTGLSQAVALATGSFHSCAVRADGTARCWGTNSNGELGDGSTANRSAPVRVSGIAAAVSLAAGGHHTCAQLGAGGVQCWGRNTSGQLGDGSTASPRLAPVSVSGVAQAAQLAAGNAFSCAFDVFENIRCWGSNANGALGNGSTVTSSTTPVLVTGGGGSIGGRAIAGGGEHSCAGRASSGQACWGLGFFGQLGDGNQPNDSLLPVAVKANSPIGSQPLDQRSVSAVAAGSGHSCSLTGEGAVLCWGSNQFGQLGNGSTAQTQSVPGNAASNLSNAVGVAAGSDHACAVQAGGSVQCWGRNNRGQLGNGNNNDRNVPATVLAGVFINNTLTTFPLGNITAVAAGQSHTCALSGDGRVLCWGDNRRGQLAASATTLSSNLPLAVAGVTNAVAVVAGGAYSCAVRASGTVQCWGANDHGQLGDDSTTDRFAPVFAKEILPEARVTLSGIVALGAGGAHTCALRADSRVQCWGANVRGQLGDGTNTEKHLAFARVQRITGEGVFVQSGFVSLGLGFQHSCALVVNGEPLCWGRNTSGQLGNGGTSDSAFALPVPSFIFNVDPKVVLNGSARVATVTALVNCPVGQQVHIDIGLTQGSASGRGHAVGICQGALERYPVVVPSQGAQGFAEGRAQAAADASVREHGAATDTEHWTRQVDLGIGDH